MKKLLTKKLLTILIIFSIIPTVQAAQQMRDMSMSVEQTNELIKKGQEQVQTTTGGTPGLVGTPGINAGTGFDDSVPLDPNMAKQMRDINSRTTNQGKLPIMPAGIIPPPPTHGEAQQNYINQFCNTALNNNSQSCLETQRQQACDRFTKATVNVQRILSQAIDCELNTTGIVKSGCDGLDAGRLDLLKQYWQDEDMSYTILFLPDMVVNIAANCAGKK